MLFIGFMASATAQELQKSSKYTKNEIVNNSSDFFGKSAESLAEIINIIFSKYGDPDAFIVGKETSVAFTFGLRYGNGKIVMKNGDMQPIYWRGPSAGWDFGGNITKTFTLVYNIDGIEDIFRRFPSIAGEAFLIGGISVTYQRKNNIIIVPIRVGIGTRLGLNIGYTKYTPKKGISPF